MEVEILQGDITTFEGDALINAAKITLEGGGGVDGAIHRAAGPGLLEECKGLPVLQTLPDGTPLRCLVGDVEVTGGHDLKVEYVIHTVGPVWPGAPEGAGHPGGYEQPEGHLRHLVASVMGCLTLAQKLGCKSVAFPALSCGIFGGRISTFAQVLHMTLRRVGWEPIESLKVYLFDEADLLEFSETWAALEMVRGDIDVGRGGPN